MLRNASSAVKELRMATAFLAHYCANSATGFAKRALLQECNFNQSKSMTKKCGPQRG
jgi:hypothetical protein